MGRKGQSPEQIIAKLREAEVFFNKGKTVAEACRAIGVCEQTFYRWRNEYGGLKVDQAKKLKSYAGMLARLLSALDDRPHISSCLSHLPPDSPLAPPQIRKKPPLS